MSGTAIYPSRGGKSWLMLVVAVAVILGLSYLSSLVVTANMGWYDGLQKPWFNPPPVTFGIVWPVLYILMTVAAWRIWRRGHIQNRSLVLRERQALRLFLLQLAVNMLWTPLFFGLQSPSAGLVWLVILWPLVVATAYRFYRLCRLSGVLMLPYVAWASFALYLSYSIWLLNPPS